MTTSGTANARSGRWPDCSPPQIWCVRRPPTVQTFLRQRIRQAYDDFAQPPRLVWEAGWLPALLGLAMTRRPHGIAAVAVGAVVVAEFGRRRAGGVTAFPPTSALWAPLWTLERSVGVWLAIAARARGGVRYRGTRLPHAARPVRPRPPLSPAQPVVPVGAPAVHVKPPFPAATVEEMAR